MLPHGTGKSVRVAVFAEGDKAREAEEAGADVVGSADLREDRGGLHRLRRRDRDARPDGQRRQARPRARAARPDAEPEDGDGHLRRRQGRVGREGAASSSTAPTAARASTCRSARRASASGTCSRTTPRCSRRSCARSRRRPRAATSSGITLATTMGPGVKVDPTRTRGIVEELEAAGRPGIVFRRQRPSPETAGSVHGHGRRGPAEAARMTTSSPLPSPPPCGLESFQEEVTWTRTEKELVVAELTERLRTTETLIVADYRGLTNAEIDALRTKADRAGARFAVVKNTLTRRAAEAAGADALLALLEGPTRDRVRRERRRSGCRREGARRRGPRRRRCSRSAAACSRATSMSAEEVENLAKLPPAEVLRAQLVGAIVSPLTTVRRAALGAAARPRRPDRRPDRAAAGPGRHVGRRGRRRRPTETAPAAEAPAGEAEPAARRDGRRAAEAERQPPEASAETRRDHCDATDERRRSRSNGN